MSDKSLMIDGVFMRVAICPVCDTRHAFEHHTYAAANQRRGPKGMQIYCPNGHSWHYAEGESEKDKLRRECELLRQRIAQKDDEILSARRQLSAQKGVTTKLKKRADERARQLEGIE